MSSVNTTRLLPGETVRDERADDLLLRGAPKSRVQLDLTPRSMGILSELKEKTEAASYAEVIRNALKLYDGLITEVENGNSFLVQDKDGKISPFRMFL